MGHCFNAGDSKHKSNCKLDRNQAFQDDQGIVWAPIVLTMAEAKEASILRWTYNKDATWSAPAQSVRLVSGGGMLD